MGTRHGLHRGTFFLCYGRDEWGNLPPCSCPNSPKGSSEVVFIEYRKGEARVIEKQVPNGDENFIVITRHPYEGGKCRRKEERV